MGFDDCLLDGLINTPFHAFLQMRCRVTVCQIGFASGALKQRLDAAILYCRFIAVERIARHAHDLAGLRYIAQLTFVPVPGHWGTLPLSAAGAPNGTTAKSVHRRA